MGDFPRDKELVTWHITYLNGQIIIRPQSFLAYSPISSSNIFGEKIRPGIWSGGAALNCPGLRKTLLGPLYPFPLSVKKFCSVSRRGAGGGKVGDRGQHFLGSSFSCHAHGTHSGDFTRLSFEKKVFTRRRVFHFNTQLKQLSNHHTWSEILTGFITVA